MVCENMIIAVSGKGGVGKTVFSAMTIKYLTSIGKKLLAVDADPDANLAEALGVGVENTIGGIREELQKTQHKIPGGISKEAYLQRKIQEIISEHKGFDLLVMGRAEGQGCYCWVNNILRENIDKLSANYDYTIIDCEAGLEHLSRRTTKDVDLMIIVMDQSRLALSTAKRIKVLAKEVGINFKRIGAVINRGDNEIFTKELKKEGIEVLGSMPEDKEITRIYSEGKAIMGIGDNAMAYSATQDIWSILARVK